MKSNMTLLCLMLLFAPVALNAQNDELFKQLKDFGNKKGVRTIVVNGQAVSIPDDQPNKSFLESLAKQVDQMIVLTFDLHTSNKWPSKAQSWLNELITENSLDPLIDLNRGGTTAFRLYMMPTEGNKKGYLMESTDEKEYTLLYVTGSLEMKEVLKALEQNKEAASEDDDL